MSMVTSSAIKMALQAWIVAEIGALDDAHVIFAEQPAPRAPGLFCTIKVTGVRNIGSEHHYGWGADPGKPAKVPRKMSGDRVGTVSIQVFGADALDVAREIAQGFVKQSARDAFHAAGFTGPLDVPNVLDLSALLETKWEQRAQFDVDLYFGDTYTDDTYVIETVTGTEKLDYPAGTEVRSIDFNSEGA